ncbi:MAG: response regulator transcription factor [Anaerotignaceae bacterium]
MKLLIVEDEVQLSNILGRGLKKLGYAVDFAYDGEEALELTDINQYDLIVLDLNLPKIDGLSVLSKIRSINPTIKILILSAKNQLSDKIEGLDLGANDYLTKPFDFLELEARIRALLRRNFFQQSTIIDYAGIRIDTSKKQVFIENNLIELTKKEYSILEYLALKKEMVISAEELIEHIWDSETDLFSNALKFHMSSLRKKLNINCIQTVRGYGYKLSQE